MNPRLPGPDLLAEAPELGAIALLELALEVAGNALIAVNGELASDDLLHHLAQHPSVHACLADAVLRHIHGLQLALVRYRDYATIAVEAMSQVPRDF